MKGKVQVLSSSNDYVIRVHDSPLTVDAAQWNALLATHSGAGPFMRHEYLAAMHESASAIPATGWTPRFITLASGGQLVAACALYLKTHSYGEYVFDWAWANAYAEHGLEYYPKGLVAPPFTPVPGTRLLARDDKSRRALLDAALAWCADEKLSSLHLLFCSDVDLATCEEAGLMLRHTVQFHWQNRALPYAGFEEFLGELSQEKRKKIRQERRKVTQAGVVFEALRGQDITPADWDFFYRCYERTYLEHGNAPYLTRDFFARMAGTMAQNWLLFIGRRDDRAIAASLIAVDTPAAGDARPVAYGRYWGALERVDCLHFEACYYQPIEWCIANGFARFEGGAQGEHKMARALLPVKASSAHWLAHPAFADAVDRFLTREAQGVEGYLDDLTRRSPFRKET